MKKFEESPIGKLFYQFFSTYVKVAFAALILGILIVGTPIIYWKSKSLYRDVKTSYVRWTIGFDKEEYIKVCNDEMANRFKQGQFEQIEAESIGSTKTGRWLPHYERVKYKLSVEPYVMWCESEKGIAYLF
jgi:hypothetical protein